MKTRQYLTFSLQKLHYGIEATLVQEILPLPELTVLKERERNLIGIINLRGQIVPIIDLDLVQSPVKQCHLSDQIIVLQCQGLQFGIIIHQVNEVLNLNPDKITERSETDNALISGCYQVDTDNIMLLEPQALINQLNSVLPLIWDAQMQLDRVVPEYAVEQQDEKLQIAETCASFYDLYCPNTTSEEQIILRKRAEELKLSSSIKITNKLIPLAIIGFSDEYFGLDLKLVRAFIDISNITPIPGCPNHIVGNMNLRGEIITLVDIRQVLNIPVSTISIGSQAVLVQVDDIVAGLPVEQVLDMVELNSVEQSSLATVSASFSKEYIQETTFFQGKMLSVLDLPKIFTQGGLAVNEEV